MTRRDCARAQGICMAATGRTRDEAAAAIADAQGSVKTAIVMILTGQTADEAAAALERADGSARAAIEAQ